MSLILQKDTHKGYRLAILLKLVVAPPMGGNLSVRFTPIEARMALAVKGRFAIAAAAATSSAVSAQRGRSTAGRDLSGVSAHRRLRYGRSDGRADGLADVGEGLGVDKRHHAFMGQQQLQVVLALLVVEVVERHRTGLRVVQPRKVVAAVLLENCAASWCLNAITTGSGIQK